MLLNNYSLRIVGGTETPGGYVSLHHTQTYQIQLRNNNPKRCDARVEVDGKHVGTWRLEAFSTATLEHPADDEGRFTFYKVGTSESQAAQLSEGSPDLGLVKVTYTPEVTPVYSYTYIPQSTITWGQTYYSNTTGAAIPKSLDASVSYRSAGGTGLSGHSNQNYGQAGEISYDYSGQTTIFLRLVCVDNDGPRPLTQFSTPVPPPVR